MRSRSGIPGAKVGFNSFLYRCAFLFVRKMTISQDANIKNFLSLLNKLNAHQNFILEETSHCKINLIKRRLQDVERLRSQFEDIASYFGTASVIIAPDSDGDDNGENESDARVEYQFGDIREQIFEVLALCDDVIEKAGIQSSSSSYTPSNVSNVNVKLPTIELPTFSGNYTEFASFFDTFKSLIGDND